jgi:predicted secreted Zn-dependent protease
MADNLKEKGPRDKSAISLQEDWEVKYWTTALGCSVMDLKAAVDAVGHSAERVKEYLEKK